MLNEGLVTYIEEKQIQLSKHSYLSSAVKVIL